MGMVEQDGCTSYVAVGPIRLKCPTFPFRMAWHIAPRHCTFPYAKLVSTNSSVTNQHICYDFDALQSLHHGMRHGYDRLLNCSPQDLLTQFVSSLLTVEARYFPALERPKVSLQYKLPCFIDV